MKLANPAPLGLFGFATTTWLLSMVNAGWLPATTVPIVLAMAFAFGGTAQFAAGLMEMAKGNSFGFIAFCSYGAFWWSFALFVKFFAGGVPASAVGWYLLVWGAFTFAMWLASFALNRAVFLVFLALWITFFLLGLSPLLGAPGAHHARRLYRADHRSVRFLPGGSGDHQRGPWPHPAAGRRAHRAPGTDAPSGRINSATKFGRFLKKAAQKLLGLSRPWRLTTPGPA